MMDALNSLFWLTGAAVWGVVGTCFVLLLYGEWSYTRAANRFRRAHLTPEEYATLKGSPAAAQKDAPEAETPNQGAAVVPDA
jgi:hypothetical protein